MVAMRYALFEMTMSYYLLIYHVLICTRYLIFIVFYKVFVVSISEMEKLRFKEVMLLVNRDGKWQRKDVVD